MRKSKNGQGSQEIEGRVALSLTQIPSQSRPDRHPADWGTLDRWLTPARAAILTQTRYLDEDWPAHWT